MTVCDLGATPSSYPHNTFDGVLCNPPFYIQGSQGRHRPKSSQKSDAHFESTLGIDGFVKVIADLLRPGGTGWLVHDPSEGLRLQEALRSGG